jgi:hypothetical protein
MAKWDLSKLPEGRKPLSDEWFAERAQMQERIKELEAKLAKAVWFTEIVEKCGNGSLWDLARTTLAELTGGKDDRNP